MAEKSTSPKRKILSLKERAEILRLADEKGPEVCWWIVAYGCICIEFVFLTVYQLHVAETIPKADW